MKFYGWSEEKVAGDYGMTGAQGWIYYYWALENEASLFGSNLERSTPGYVKQEKLRILSNGS